ncbi:ATP-binding protein [Thermoactinospora rubra]|uniref:ATP-binding protein n=1 Tax=Thermoactinospora rubra TaxID=1088767 RepID=UPI001301E815|nr:NACHT domain-containing protein [Thermoactinospora rubra]
MDAGNRAVDPQHPKGRLPAETTSFVGRRLELAEAVALLGRTRLLTLTGAGGVGKTRLARRLAHTVRGDYDDGAFYVCLAEVRDPRMLGRAVAAALGLADQTARPAEEVLRAHLPGRRLLLVLDGADHLVGACAHLVDLVLRCAPGVTVVVTSRQVLGVQYEQVLTVPPLSPPDAVALFAERAPARPPLTAETEERIATLCRRLDLLPLAIELAAVRLRALPLERIIAQLAPLELAGQDTTLRAAIGWSHELCAPAERLLWARMSVFTSCFSLAAAETVCSDERLPRAEIVDLVRGLLDKSILSREELPDGVRFRLLDSIKEYGAEWLHRLDQEEAERLGRRHKEFYLELARHSEAAWFGPHQRAIFARTRCEMANFRVAFERCDAEEALELAATLWFYWVGCGQLGEGRDWLERALSNVEAAPKAPAAHAKALWVAGYVCVLGGEFARARRLLEDCRALGDPATIAHAVHRLGGLALVGGDHDRAIDLFNAALDLYARRDVLECNVLMACVELAMALAFRDRLKECTALCEQVRETCEGVGEEWVRSHADYAESYVAWLGGDREHALRLALRCLEVSHHFHDLFGTVLAVELIALLRAERGEYERAAVLQGAAARIWPSVGPRLFRSRYFNAPHAACAHLARRALGRRAFAAARARGERLGLDAAVTLAARQDRGVRLPLAPREWEVARLVAAGLSDAEAAERLVTSEHTVAAIVAQVMAKLGLSRRAQIADWIREQASARPPG